MPGWIRNYVIVHELSHLVEPNHGENFLHAWVVMPDHIHLLITPDNGRIIKAINRLKGRSGLCIKKRYPELKAVWNPSFWERRLRSDKEIQKHSEYIILNPVKNNYCASPELWRWSSVNEDEIKMNANSL